MFFSAPVWLQSVLIWDTYGKCHLNRVIHMPAEIKSRTVSGQRGVLFPIILLQFCVDGADLAPGVTCSAYIKVLHSLGMVVTWSGV